MFSQTLIAYASRYGSTKEIAERIASVLKEQGISTTLNAAEDVTSVDSFDAVIVGSALYGGTWLPEAKEFLESFQAELAKKEVWVFSSGPATDDNPATVLGGWKAPEPLKHILDVIRPLPTHPAARLNVQEKAQLIAGLQVTFGVGEGGEEGE